jgi:hypothetical protein
MVDFIVQAYRKIVRILEVKFTPKPLFFKDGHCCPINKGPETPCLELFKV